MAESSPVVLGSRESVRPLVLPETPDESAAFHAARVRRLGAGLSYVLGIRAPRDEIVWEMGSTLVMKHASGLLFTTRTTNAEK